MNGMEQYAKKTKMGFDVVVVEAKSL